MLPENIELEIVTPERHVLHETVQVGRNSGQRRLSGRFAGPCAADHRTGHRRSDLSQGFARRAYLTVIDGYAEVLPDRVIVLAEISERAEEIDVGRTRAALDRAKTEVSKTDARDPEWERANLALQRAMVRLQAASKSGAAGAHE